MLIKSTPITLPEITELHVDSSDFLPPMTVRMRTTTLIRESSEDFHSEDSRTFPTDFERYGRVSETFRF